MGDAKQPNEKPTGLALLREPFPEHQISKLAKETRAQIDERKSNKNCIVWNCPVCGGHHHQKAVHLDYVGHAALTDRLLDADPHWAWEPVVMEGLPNPGQGMWIRLTVCGVSRLGYGSADGKTGGNAIKEIIGDALRNAAMRFGAALDLWHKKGDLHGADEVLADEKPAEQAPAQPGTKAKSRDLYTELQKQLRACKSSAELRDWGANNVQRLQSLPEDWYCEIKAEYAKELEAMVGFEETEKRREQQGEYNDLPV